MGASTQVHVYRQTLVGHVSEMGGAQSGGTVISYQVDPSSVQPVASPETPVDGRPTLSDFLCQPCSLVGTHAGCAEAGSYTQLFLGAKDGVRLVALSRPVFSRRMGRELFAARDELRAQIATLTQAGQP